MFILDKLVHCEGSYFTDALNEATAEDLLAALRRPDLVTRRCQRIIDALRVTHDIAFESDDEPVFSDGP